ncbi:MAG: dockerin type I repeat-containing protein [Ruminococcus sp.]|nr:dockerin type I repeat-containing protein [Ruminococcus sp.]
MNKKLKKILVYVSTVAMCAVSVVSTNVGAEYYTSDDGIIFEDFTELGDDNGVTGIIDGKICGYGLKIATRGELTLVSDVWFDFMCYAQLNEEKVNELSEFLAENYPFIATDVTEYESEYFCVTLDYQEELSYEKQFQIAVDIYKSVNIQCAGVVLANSIPVKELKMILSEPTILGDANEDGKVTIADTVLIMQALSNPDDFKLTPQGMANADIVGDGDGVTVMDALRIQEMEINM